MGLLSSTWQRLEPKDNNPDAVLCSRSTSPDNDQGPRPPKVFDVDPERRRERERQLAIRQAEMELAGDNGVKEKPKEDLKVEVSPA